MCIDIENITKIINQVTGLNLSPKCKWDSRYRFYDDEHFDIYITVDEVENDVLSFTISKFDKDTELVKALKLVYPNSRIWMTRYA